MAMLNKLRLRLRALFFKSKMEDELQAKLQFHLEREIEENIARGMTPEDARYAALRSFGGVELVKEESRDVRGVRLLEEVWQDLCYGARMLMKNYGFTIAAALCLALGIGVNTSLFSVVHALLLRSFPVPQADQLVVLTQDERNLPIPYRNFVRIRKNNEVLSDLAAFEYVRFSFGNRDQSEFISGELVSGNYFDALKLKPTLGRTFLPEEDRIPDAHPVVVLSYRFWQSRLSGAPDVIGRTIILNRHPFTVIGVAPQGFKGMVTPFLTSVWIPLMMSRVKHEIKRADDLRDFEPDSADELLSFGRVSPIGRLKPGVSLSQAQAAIETFSPRSDEPDEDNRFRLIRPEGIYIGNTGDMRRQVTKATTLMGVIAGIVLLITCCNLANLLLARASVRRKEIAVRMALGASRLRLIRLLMTESALLALAGGGIGLLVASLFNHLCIAFIPRMATFDPDLRLDAPVLGFTLLLSMVTSVLFGLTPALQVSKLNFVPALKDEFGKGALHTRTINLRSALVIGQVAISLPLLICAGLFIRSLQKEQAIDLGFKTENHLVLWLSLKVVGYDQKNGLKFLQQLLDRVRAVPGVLSASVARDIPSSGSGSDCYSQDSARPSVDIPVFDCSNNEVGSQFFHTMGISVVRGREFTAQDGERGNKVVVINESLARRYWPGEDPLGKQLRIGESSNPLSEIVGIVKDSVDSGSKREEPPPMLYTPFQDTESMSLIIHTSIDPNGMIQPLRREISLLDENLPMKIATMNELISSPWWQRLGVTLLSILGGLGLLLTAVGIYGVTAYIVAQRTHEFGVRVALGARGRDVMKLVIRQGMWLVLIGVVIGMAASLAVSRVLKSFLYGLSAADPMTFGIIPLLLAAVALLACYVPARRATKVDPMIALRSE
jgi:predicted permease